ncbi:hypothetical protein M752DRAFT_313004 [Aspergillus phoenicis ATCC 13157]|uniref:Uncharacterized protein n=1 Tax=Aspergillus phoenicis ATCC 13157 TaxID=1353007 RepID=A0A370PPR8_ASPPH|nr:hypothetical protein M752DRAFT_313004 [Aspergillus phoenicis ATCC 13157]
MAISGGILGATTGTLNTISRGDCCTVHVEAERHLGPQLGLSSVLGASRGDTARDAREEKWHNNIGNSGKFYNLDPAIIWRGYPAICTASIRFDRPTQKARSPSSFIGHQRLFPVMREFPRRRACDSSFFSICQAHLVQRESSDTDLSRTRLNLVSHARYDFISVVVISLFRWAMALGLPLSELKLARQDVRVRTLEKPTAGVVYLPPLTQVQRVDWNTPYRFYKMSHGIGKTLLGGPGSGVIRWMASSGKHATVAEYRRWTFIIHQLRTGCPTKLVAGKDGGAYDIIGKGKRECEGSVREKKRGGCETGAKAGMLAGETGAGRQPKELRLPDFQVKRPAPSQAPFLRPGKNENPEPRVQLEHVPTWESARVSLIGVGEIPRDSRRLANTGQSPPLVRCQSIPNYGMEISLIYLLVVLLARKGCMPPPGHVSMAHIDSKEPPFHVTLHYDTVHETNREREREREGELSVLSTLEESKGPKLIIGAWFYPSAPSFHSTCGVVCWSLHTPLGRQLDNTNPPGERAHRSPAQILGRYGSLFPTELLDSSNRTFFATLREGSSPPVVGTIKRDIGPSITWVELVVDTFWGNHIAGIIIHAWNG